MPHSPEPVLPADVAHPTGLLHTLLAMSLTAVAVLRPLYEADADVIRDFAWIYLNPAGQRMLQQPACPTASLLTLFPTAQADGVFEKCCQAFLTGEVQRNQTYYLADGLDGYFLLVAQRYENLLVVNFTDTSDQPRTAAEEALRASQAREQAARAEVEQQRVLALAAQRETEAQRQRLHDFMSAAPGVVLSLVGPQHVIEFANEGFRQQFGVPDPVGKPYLEALPGAADQYSQEYQATALYDHIYRTGEPYYAAEAPYYVDPTHSGQRELRYFSFAVQAARDGSGHIVGVQAYAADVTEQVRARQQVQDLNEELEARVQERTRQLNEQQALLRQILSQVPAAIATLSGPTHRYSFFNGLYQELSAHRTEVGLTVAAVFPEVVAQGFIDLLDQVYRTGEPFIGTNMPADLYDTTRGQSRQYYVDFIFQPLFDNQQQVQGILAFILDVTDKVFAHQQVQVLNEEVAAINEELRATNEELSDSNTRLLHTNADLDTFVYTASHDLKAPIANIEGLLDVLSEYLPTDDQEPMVPQLMSRMRGAIARFQQTVGHLTDMSHLQYQTGLAQEEVNLARVVDDVRLDLLPLLESTQSQLLLEVQDCPPIHFAFKDLRSIVYNLLSNAVKYRAPDRPPVVQLRAYCEAQQVVLEVQDNGLGLNKQQQGKLFTMFKRLHYHVEGSGVGLYMIKRLIENAGGIITVQSQLGVGSRFTVTLPRAER
jgi:signal transduction histidine kinase